jgi:hypothetical protein
MCEANVRIYYYNVLQYKLRIQHSLECGWTSKIEKWRIYEILGR